MIETIPSGTVLHGRYRIERVLGSGGFGHVYLSVNVETKQQCAVKEYLVSGTSGQEQLKHEARVLSQLHHPNIPAFLDAFMERGRYYVVLNYIEGHDLTDLLRITRQRNDIIPITQILQWMLAICDAVMFLHNQHPIVIHRDIKPDNIRITPNGTAILVDLGNAKAVADGARTLFFIRHQGTPGYAPPEQYPGGAGTDARSDVYALGGTLYFALTGQEPNSVSVRNQLMQQHKTDLPSLQEKLSSNPPETQGGNELRQFRLGVTKPGKPMPKHSKHLAQLGTLAPEHLNRLNQIIQRAMAMRPKDRYQFVADFANDLRHVLETLPPTPQALVHSSAPSPYATEPNLQERFEAIQSSRERVNQGNPVTVQASANYCPRCNAPLVAQAAFCPHCGTALGNKSGTQNNNNASVKNSNASPMTAVKDAIHSSSPQQNFSGQGQQAVMYSQQQQGSVATQIQPRPATRSNNHGIDIIARATTRMTDGNQNTAFSSTNIKIAIIIAVIVILAIIIALLLAHPGH